MRGVGCGDRFYDRDLVGGDALRPAPFHPVESVAVGPAVFLVRDEEVGRRAIAVVRGIAKAALPEGIAARRHAGSLQADPPPDLGEARFGIGAVYDADRAPRNRRVDGEARVHALDLPTLVLDGQAVAKATVDHALRSPECGERLATIVG